MRTLSYWIQHADFSSTEFDPVTQETAIGIVKTYNWAAEFKLMTEHKAAGRETCPSGIGFVESRGNLLHICLCDSRTAMIHYHHADRSRLLGIIPIAANNSVRTNVSVPMNDVDEFVRHFFLGDRAWLESNTTAG